MPFSRWLLIKSHCVRAQSMRPFLSVVSSFQDIYTVLRLQLTTVPAFYGASECSETAFYKVLTTGFMYL